MQNGPSANANSAESVWVEQCLEQLKVREASQQLALWNYWTQNKSFLLPTTAFDGLANVETIRRVMAAKTANVESRRRVLVSLISIFVANETKQVAETVTRIESSASLSFEGDDIRLRELEMALSKTDGPVRRQALCTSAVESQSKVNVARTKLEDAEDAALSKLGLSFGDFAELWVDASLESIESAAIALQKQSALEWEGLLKVLTLPRLRMAAERVSACDFPRLIVAPAELDGGFKAENLRANVLAAQAVLPGPAAHFLLRVDANVKAPFPLGIRTAANEVSVATRAESGFRAFRQTFLELGRTLGQRDGKSRFSGEDFVDNYERALESQSVISTLKFAADREELFRQSSRLLRIYGALRDSETVLQLLGSEASAPNPNSKVLLQNSTRTAFLGAARRVLARQGQQIGRAY